MVVFSSMASGGIDSIDLDASRPSEPVVEQIVAGVMPGRINIDHLILRETRLNGGERGDGEREGAK